MSRKHAAATSEPMVPPTLVGTPRPARTLPSSLDSDTRLAWMVATAVAFAATGYAFLRTTGNTRDLRIGTSACAILLLVIGAAFYLAEQRRQSVCIHGVLVVGNVTDFHKTSGNKTAATATVEYNFTVDGRVHASKMTLGPDASVLSYGHPILIAYHPGSPERNTIYALGVPGAD